MIDLLNREYFPTLQDVASYIGNPVFMQFCDEIKSKYSCNEKIEYSLCSLEKGWNVKFKKSGKSLCTIYPRESFFTVLVVVGKKEKEEVEKILPDCSLELQELYANTKEFNGQKWLMINLEDCNKIYSDVLRLIEIRKK